MLRRAIRPVTSRLNSAVPFPFTPSASVSASASTSSRSISILIQPTIQNQPQPRYRTIHHSPKHFSASAHSVEEEVEPTKPKRTLKKKDPIMVTERAADRIKELLSSPNAKESNSIGIRLGVKRRGCNGLSYTLNYAAGLQPNEEELEAHGIKVFIEPMALFSVVGTVMDYEVTDMSSEFTFLNPNSKGECGCGESFNV